MIRTALFGGSFDPIHMGHAMVANFVAQCGLVDEVWLMPGRVNPLKCAAPPAPESHRVEMCRLVAQDCIHTVVSEVELSLPSPSYTSQTVRHLLSAYPDRKFSLLIGSDNWLCFNRWREYDWLLKHIEVIIYPRPGYEVNKDELPEGVSLLEDAPQVLMSSTFARAGLAGGLNMNFFLPSKVINYISNHQLYG